MCTPFLPRKLSLLIADCRIGSADVTFAGAALAEKALCKTFLVDFVTSKAVIGDAFA